MWLSIIISKTGGISYAVLGLTQTKTIKISRWFYNAAAISVHREPPPAGTVVHVWTRCRALPGVRLPSCTPVSADQESSLTVPCCEDAFPPTCALETGQQRSSSSHWWFIIYGPDSRRKLASFFPWQANISALSLCHWGWTSCSIQDFYLFFSPYKVWFRPLMCVTVCPAQQQSPKQKTGDDIPKTLRGCLSIIYHPPSWLTFLLEFYNHLLSFWC